MNDTPIDLDQHRGMRRKRPLISVACSPTSEANAKLLRDRQSAVESQLLATPATSWAEAAAKARYVLNLYADQLAPADTHHRDLIAAVVADFTRLSSES
jgi:hypothetical protein